jgi:hypothetical protein
MGRGDHLIQCVMTRVQILHPGELDRRFSRHVRPERHARIRTVGVASVLALAACLRFSGRTRSRTCPRKRAKKRSLHLDRYVDVHTAKLGDFACSPTCPANLMRGVVRQPDPRPGSIVSASTSTAQTHWVTASRRARRSSPGSAPSWSSATAQGPQTHIPRRSTSGARSSSSWHATKRRRCASNVSS